MFVPENAVESAAADDGGWLSGQLVSPPKEGENRRIIKIMIESIRVFWLGNPLEFELMTF